MLRRAWKRAEEGVRGFTLPRYPPPVKLERMDFIKALLMLGAAVVPLLVAGGLIFYSLRRR